ncbi:MAG: hypothetical protein GVY19_10710 [Bacteroidetes bacterium]|nr:hypothetical protein [Bacteroidota bacterium]
MHWFNEMCALASDSLICDTTNEHYQTSEIDPNKPNRDDGINIATNNIQVSSRFLTGFIGDPEYNFQHIIQGYPVGINIDLSTHFTPGVYSSDNTAYAFRKGLNFYRIHLANPDVLGSVMAVTPFLECAIYINELFSPSLRIGMGLAYADKPHHRLENYKNTLIGSHFNVSLSSKLLLNIRVSRNIDLQGGLSVIHISNGNTVTPNDGINLFSVESGISCHFYTKNSQKPTRHKTKTGRNNYMCLTTMASVTNFQHEVQTGFNYYTLMAEWIHLLNPYLGLGLGIDFTHNNASAEKVSFDPILPAENNQLGIKGIAEVPLNNFSIMLQIGIINNNTYRMYNWLVFRHTVYKNLYLNLSYRAYGFTEGHLGWGIGIKL